MKKIYILAILLLMLGILRYLGVVNYFSFENFVLYFQQMKQYYLSNPRSFMVVYFCLYVCLSSAPIPGEMTMTLLGGAVMGFLPALILVSFASTLGGCVAMLTSRYLFRDVFARKFSAVYEKVQQNFAEDGAYYVFMLRMIPAPFFIVNIVLGLTSVSLPVFYIVSQFGMLTTTALVAKAGAELGLVENLTELFSPIIISLLVLIGVFPLTMKKMFSMRNTNKNRLDL